MTRIADLPAHLRPMARAALDGAGPAPTGADAPRGPQKGRLAARRAIREAPLPLVLALPFPPPLTNARGAGRGGLAQHVARTAYLAHCDALLAMHRLPKPLGWPWAPPLVRATLEIAAVVARLHDTDNLVARLKPACDFLVRAKYVADDSPAHLTWLGLPTQRVRRAGEAAHVVLTISPVEGA